MELSLASLPFEATALARAEPLDIEGRRVPVALAEDLVIYKAVAWRDRDRADIERLLIAHGDAMDLANVRKMVAEFAAFARRARARRRLRAPARAHSTAASVENGAHRDRHRRLHRSERPPPRMFFAFSFVTFLKRLTKD